MASTIIVVGAGFKNKEDLDLVFELAKYYNAQVACTRAIVEKGWLDSSYQVGLSGVSIMPKSLITLGVSGSVQFVAGISKCKNIIAINNDKNALIFNIAHHGYCLDLYQFIEQLIKINKKKEI